MNRHVHQLPAVLGLAALLPLASMVSATESSQPTTAPQGKKYNILSIAVDDLNDWVGCLGGKPELVERVRQRMLELDKLSKSMHGRHGKSWERECVMIHHSAAFGRKSTILG